MDFKTRTLRRRVAATQDPKIIHWERRLEDILGGGYVVLSKLVVMMFRNDRENIKIKLKSILEKFSRLKAKTL